MVTDHDPEGELNALQDTSGFQFVKVAFANSHSTVSFDDRFQQEVSRSRRNDTVDTESGSGKQRSILRGCALTTARDGEHDDVERLAEMRARRVGDERLDEQRERGSEPRDVRRSICRSPSHQPSRE